MFSQSERDQIIALEPHIEITGTVILAPKQDLERLRWENTKCGMTKALQRFRAKSIVRVEKYGYAEYFEYNHNAAHTPNVNDVMSCLILDASAAAESLREFFETFCGEEDKLKGFGNYLDCNETREKLAKMFGRYNLSLLHRYTQGIDSGECDPLWEMHKSKEGSH